MQRLEISDEKVATRKPTIVNSSATRSIWRRRRPTAQATRNSARDRFIWDLIWTTTGERRDLQGAVRHRSAPKCMTGYSRRSIRSSSPSSPIAYLGAPRTTRQGRALSLAGAIVAVSSVRLLGFVATVLCVRYPVTLAIQYLVVLARRASGLCAIGRGLIIEPPAFVTECVIAAISARLPRRAAAAT